MDNQHTNINALNNLRNQDSGFEGRYSDMNNQHNQNLEMNGQYNGPDMTNKHGSMDKQRTHDLGSQPNNLNSQYSDMNSQHTGLNNDPIRDQENGINNQPTRLNNQHDLKSQYADINNQRTDMVNHPISNQQNNVHNQSTGFNHDNSLHDQGLDHCDNLHGQGSDHHNHLHDKFTGLIHHDQSADSNNQHNNNRNMAGATVEDINRSTHQQTDPPFHVESGMNSYHSQDSHHLSNMTNQSGQHLDSNTTGFNPVQDINHSENMTPTSHPVSSNNNTSLWTKQSEHVKDKDGISSVSSTPSEYGSSDDNISHRTDNSRDIPVADKNAFIQSNDTKKHWQHSMSPAARAKELGVEMDHVIHGRKSTENKSLKIGETKEYKLD